MKKFLYSTILLSLAFSANAKTETFEGVSDGRKPITGTNNTTDIILDSSNGKNYTASGAVVKSITAINGEVSIANVLSWNGNQGITVDINSATEDVNAVTAGIWSHNLFTLAITNSVANSTATANLSFDTLTISSQSKQDGWLKFVGVNANVTTVNATALGVGTQDYTQRSTLSVDKDSTVEWNGEIKSTKLGIIDIAGNYTHNSKLTLYTGATYNVSGTVVQNGAFHADTGANVNISGKQTQRNLISWTKDVNVSITGELAIDYENEMVIGSHLNLAGKITQTSKSGDNGIKFNGTVNLLSGSTLQAYGKISLEVGASLTVNQGANLDIVIGPNPSPRIIMDRATLTFNEENCLSFDGRNGALVTLTGKENNILTSKVYFNASQKIHNIYVAPYSIIEIYLADDVDITLTAKDINPLNGNGDFKIYNFQEDSIYVGFDGALPSTAKDRVYLYDAENNFLGNAFVTDKGYLSLLQTVPEPAEWAMLLGAIALSLAIYRRRK